MHTGQLAKAAPLLLSWVFLAVLQVRGWLCSALWDSLAAVPQQLKCAEFVLTNACTAPSLSEAMGFVMCLLPDTSVLSQLGACHMSQPRA